MKKESKIDPDFTPTDVVIGIAAGIEADQFESLMEIEPDGFCVAGLGFQDDGSPFLLNGNFLCFVHQPFPDPFSAKRFRYPQFRYHQAV